MSGALIRRGHWSMYKLSPISQLKVYCRETLLSRKRLDKVYCKLVLAVTESMTGGEDIVHMLHES